MSGFTKTDWVSGGAPGISEAELERIEEGIYQAHLHTPAGVIYPYAGAAAPTGFLLCNGAVVAQATYADLYAVCGTTFDTGGEGAGNFRLPNLVGRFPLGKAAAGTGSTLGSTGGTIDHIHTIAHDHDATGLAVAAHAAHTHAGPSHNHSVANHAHAIAAHTHDPGTLAISGGSHTHGDSFTVGTPSVTEAVDESNPTEAVAGSGHVHTISGSVSTSSSHAHTLGGATAANTAALTTATDGGHNPGLDGTGQTGNPSASLTHAVSGATAENSDGSSTANPPYLVLQFIIKT